LLTRLEQEVAPAQYGGDKPVNFEEMWAQHDEVTKRLQKRWKKIRKELKAEASKEGSVAAVSNRSQVSIDEVR
jgi:hypothetical protein